MIQTMTDNRKQQYGRLNRKYFVSARHGRAHNCHIAISGYRSLSQSFGGTSFKFVMVELVMVENPRIAVGISMLSVIVPEMYIFPVWTAAILLFSVVGCCRNHLGTLYLMSLLSESQTLPLELQQHLFWICFVILVNMTVKFRQFQKPHVLTSCQQLPVQRLAT